MGQKVNPIGLRLGVNKTWQSKWYVDPREYADTLHEDLVLRKALLACPEVAGAEISEVEITRKPQRITMIIATARPGVIIGAKGANVEKIAEKIKNGETIDEGLFGSVVGGLTGAVMGPAIGRAICQA